jgi:hypothetical protein
VGQLIAHQPASQLLVFLFLVICHVVLS